MACRFRVALAAAVTAACMTLTWLQVEYWRDDISLYQHAVAVVPDNDVAYFNLASALDAQGAGPMKPLRNFAKLFVYALLRPCPRRTRPAPGPGGAPR